MVSETEKQHFKNLLSIAFIDGVLDKAELEFLFKKSNRFFLTQEDLDGVIENSMYVKPMAISSEEERAEKMYDLIKMMLLDGEVDDAEHRLCLIFGVNLGYSAEKVEEFMASAVDMVDQGKKTKEIVQAILKSN